MTGLTRTAREDVQRIHEAVGDAAGLDDAKIVLTGCAGFLGYTLAHSLHHMKEQTGNSSSIHLLDNFLLGEPDWLTKLAASDPDVHVHRFDVSKDRARDLPALEGTTHVLHMASVASPTYYRRFPLETIDANVWGLRHLLEDLSGNDLRGFLFFSSSEIYGDPAPEAIPTPESYRGNVACMGPRACYDEAKRFGETLCEVYANTKDVPIRIVRPFNNYGPGMRIDDGRAPADFARAVLSNENIVLHSDGTPTRTFCYVSDAVTGFLKALLHDRFDVFNIGSDGPELQIRELADLYTRVASTRYGYQGRVIHEASSDAAYLTDNPSRRCPDLAKARQTLGYAPNVDVADGVARYLDHLTESNPQLGARPPTATTEPSSYT